MHCEDLSVELPDAIHICERNANLIGSGSNLYAVKTSFRHVTTCCWSHFKGHWTQSQ